jgi:hypothetical protein
VKLRSKRDSDIEVGMEINELVEQITNNVLAKIGGGHNEPQKVLLLSRRYPFHFVELLTNVKKEYSTNEFVLLIPGCADLKTVTAVEGIQCMDMRDQKAINEVIDAYETFAAVFLLAPELNLMKSIAMLDDTDIIPYILFKFLLSEKRTGIWFKFETGKSIRSPLQNKYEELFVTLTGLGIEIIKIEGDSGKEHELLERTNDLITENNMIELYAGGLRKLSCGKNCIITALALDKARELGVQIKFES